MELCHTRDRGSLTLFLVIETFLKLLIMLRPNAAYLSNFVLEKIVLSKVYSKRYGLARIDSPLLQRGARGISWRWHNPRKNPPQSPFAKGGSC